MDCHIKCSEHNYPIFEFHHTNKSEKDYDWNKLRLRSWGDIVKELDKCDLLCSNCHRMRHHKKNQ